MTAAAMRFFATKHFLFGIDNMKDTVVALGFFDGVHIGHAKILKTAVALAKEKGCASAACTFDVHPRAFVRGVAPAMLTTLEQRCELIKTQGIEQVAVLEFTEKMAAMTPCEFATLLKEKYNCKYAVCGKNFRFGYKAQGTPESLEDYGITAVICEHVLEGGETVSSTRIRKLLVDGDAVYAASLLGRPYSLCGKVVDGFKLGRRLGRPTMNLRPENGLLIPHNGVYAARVQIDGKTFDAITNIGTRPTFSNDDIISVESHIINFDRDIYGKAASVELIEKVRDERAFSSETELLSQIDKDIEKTEEILKRG